MQIAFTRKIFPNVWKWGKSRCSRNQKRNIFVNNDLLALCSLKSTWQDVVRNALMLCQVLSRFRKACGLKPYACTPLNWPSIILLIPIWSHRITKVSTRQTGARTIVYALTDARCRFSRSSAEKELLILSVCWTQARK